MFSIKPSQLSLDSYHEAAEVCKAIHGEYSFTVLTFKREAGPKTMGNPYGPYKSTGSSNGTFAEHVKKFPKYHREGLEPFLVAGVTDGEGHADANILYTWTLWVDFDNGYPDCLVDNRYIGPSLRIETSPGHCQAGWILDEPCSASEARPVLKAMALRLGGDVAYAKPSQIIRLPGFLHSKRGTIPKLLEPTNLTKPFSLDFLKQAFDVDFISSCVRIAAPRFNANLGIAKGEASTDEASQLAADVESALPYLKDYAEDYSGWLSTLMALVPLGEKGKKLAEDFSRFSSKFVPLEFEKKWAQIQNSPGSVATIFLRAQNNGWKNPGFRNSSFDKNKTLTDRDFGRMIAAVLGDTHAVTESFSGGRRKLSYLAWNGTVYTVMKEIECRAAVEKAGLKVIDDMIERGGPSHEVIVRLKHKIGNNRSLNEVCEHVAESLVLDSRPRIVGDYPYFWVANGVINLLSQDLLPAKYQPVPVKGRSPVEYDPNARAPIFEKTVREVFEDDDELIRYFYKLIGYMMLGNQKEQIFVIFFGPKSDNGKTTLEGALSYIMGGYATILTTTSIMTKSHVTESVGSSTSQLEGKRLAVVSEIDERHTLDSGTVKQMTGDRNMPVRKMYTDSENIAIEFLLLMLTNKLPKVSEDDHGLWKRMQIVPFNRKFTKDEIDPDLPVKLKKEASGILNLMLAGARNYLLHRLTPPKKVLATNSEQRKTVDPVASFLEETMVLGVDDETPLKMLYSTYETWRLQNPNFSRLTKHQLQKKLEEKGFLRVDRGHLPSYQGLSPIEIPE